MYYSDSYLSWCWNRLVQPIHPKSFHQWRTKSVMSSVKSKQASLYTGIGYMYGYDIGKTKNTEQNIGLNTSLVYRLQRECSTGAGVRHCRMWRHYVQDPYVEAHQVHRGTDLRPRVPPQEDVAGREDGVELSYRRSQMLLPRPYPVTQPWRRVWMLPCTGFYVYRGAWSGITVKRSRNSLKIMDDVSCLVCSF
jgi:hypothetical protein